MAASVWADDFSGVMYDVTWYTATTATTFDASDRFALLVRNTSTNATYTATVTSVANRQGRTEDISITLDAGEYDVCALRTHGWVSVGGLVTVTGSNAAVEFAVVNVRD